MPIKVLVAAAAEDAMRLCRETLAPLGCQIISASSSALAVFLARKNFPALIIAGTGDRDVMELPWQIKADAELCHIPVVLICGKTDGSSLAEARASGAHKVVSLPTTPERFFDELRDFLREQEDNRPVQTPE